MPMFVRFEDGNILEGPVHLEDCPDGFVEYREVNEAPADCIDVVVTLTLENGVCVKTFTGSSSYVKQRQAAYPSAGDQLDMLWHAMNSGVLPIVEPFYSNILAIKNQYPKPSP